jgi:hypothetical protein
LIEIDQRPSSLIAPIFLCELAWLAIRGSLTDAGERRMVPVRGYAKGGDGDDVAFVGIAA